MYVGAMCDIYIFVQLGPQQSSCDNRHNYRLLVVVSISDKTYKDKFYLSRKVVLYNFSIALKFEVSRNATATENQQINPEIQRLYEIWRRDTLSDIDTPGSVEALVMIP